MPTSYDRLFSPVHIGGHRLENRVAMTAMGVNLGALGGGVNDDIIAFYEARARGGVGLIISGVCRVVDGTGASEHCQLAARDARDIQGLARLADTLHKYGTRFFLQLHHPGWNYGLTPEQPVAASAIEHPFGGRTPRALGVDEIHEIQAAFVNGARVAQAAGVDGVELHGAHGYLINGFLSPHLNHRDDDYGGSLDNRLRFVVEIVAGIRAATGRGIPLGVRISAEEFLGDEGNDLATSCVIAQKLEEVGVDFLDISCVGFSPGSPGLIGCIEPGTFPQGWKKYMAAEIKRHVKIPVIAVANVKEPDVAEAMIEEDCCDIVGIARGHLADPDWCRKAKTGRAETIRKCIGCLVCFDEIEHARRVRCSVNPVTGREREYRELRRDGAGRPVAVIGGGPAGIVAALVLQARGFHPVLFNPTERLGGTLNVADKGLDKEKISRLVDGLTEEITASGVETRLGGEITAADVEALSPCGVFIACGAQPVVPPVPGIEGRNVVTAEDVLMQRASVDGSCVVAGSGMTGLETAELLLKAGHQVTVVDMLPQIGQGAEVIVIIDTLQRMAPYDPTYLPGHRLVRITPDGVDLEELASGQPVSVAADTVVLALGVRPRPEVEVFKAAFPDAHVIGDAGHGGRIVDATADAYGKAFVFEPERSAV